MIYIYIYDFCQLVIEERVYGNLKREDYYDVCKHCYFLQAIGYAPICYTVLLSAV